MNQYPHVTDVFLQLEPKYQKVCIPHAYAGADLIIIRLSLNNVTKPTHGVCKTAREG